MCFKGRRDGLSGERRQLGCVFAWFLQKAVRSSALIAVPSRGLPAPFTLFCAGPHAAFCARRVAVPSSVLDGDAQNGVERERPFGLAPEMCHQPHARPLGT